MFRKQKLIICSVAPENTWEILLLLKILITADKRKEVLVSIIQKELAIKRLNSGVAALK